MKAYDTATESFVVWGFFKYVCVKFFFTFRDLVGSSVFVSQHLSQALLLGSAILLFPRKAPDTTVAYLKSSTNQFNKS